MFERPGGGLGFSSVSGRRLKQRGLFPFQEFLPSPGISSKGGWFWLLLDWLLSFGVQGRGGVQGKGKAGANSEGELESQALAHQRLAEVQTLGGQGGFIFTHCSHFGILLN